MSTTAEYEIVTQLKRIADALEALSARNPSTSTTKPEKRAGRCLYGADSGIMEKIYEN